MIECISAVTFAVYDMVRSVEFYKTLGFEVVYGGPASEFSTLRSGEAFVNLTAMPEFECQWWGRVIFRVEDAGCAVRTPPRSGFKPSAAGRRIMGRAILPCPRSGRA